MEDADPRYASSLANGLRVLEAWSGAGALLGNGELARRTGLSKASITRLGDTLASRGLLQADAEGRGLRLGPALLTLAYPLLAGLGVRRLARLPMKRLSDELGGTVSLGMRDRTRIVYVETSRGADLVSFRPDVGAAMPLLQSAIGRAWLAAAAAGERTAALRSVRQESPAAYRRWAPSAVQARVDWLARGWCVSRGDWRDDVHAVAVPLDVVLGGERLVLNCGMPVRRLSAGDLERRVAPRLVALARRIEADWRSETASHPVAAHIHPAAAAASSAAAAAAAARPPDDPDDRQFIRTLARGIDLLLAFQPGDDALGNRELARRLGLGPSTVARLTYTLVAHGYLRRDGASGRYRLGAAVLAAAYPMLSSLRLRELARPAMRALAERVGGSVSLGLRHRIGMVYVENAWRTDDRLVPPDTGTPMPMLASAMGRAWLAGAPAAERAAVLNRIRVFDPAGHARYARAALDGVAQCERHGHCASRDVRPEVEAFAVPFARPVDGVRYVMNCGVLAPAPLSARRARVVGMALADTVREIEALASPGGG